MSDRIKIMHIIPSLRGGGAERVCFDLLINLDQQKYETSLLLFKDNGDGQIWREKLNYHGVKIISLKKDRLIDIINFQKIYQTIKEFKPDILHTHLGGDIYGRLAGFFAKVPVIVSTEHNLNYQERKSATFLKKITSRFANQIFPVSEAVKKDAIKRYQIPAHKLTVIYNGIDLSLFNPGDNLMPTEKSNSTIVIGALGRLNEQKGFKFLIEAASKTKNKNYLVKIGGEGELKNALLTQIDQLDLKDRVTLLGQVEPISFFKNLDIFILPSLWEGLGLVVLEAALFNKPVIASAVDGIEEIISHDKGWLFRAGDSSMLAERIDEVIENLHNDSVQRKINLARKNIEEKFSLKNMVLNYKTWYDKLYQEKVKSK